MRGLCAGVATAILCPVVAAASPVQIFDLNVRGALESFDLPGLVVFDRVLEEFVTDFDYSEIVEDYLNDGPASFRDYLGSREGYASVSYFGSSGRPLFSSCSGILTTLCNGLYTTFDPVSGVATAYLLTTPSTVLEETFLFYETDGGVSGSVGNYFYYSTLEGVRVRFSITDIDVTPLTPVPLPAAGMLLLGAMASLGLVRGRRAQRV